MKFLDFLFGKRVANQKDRVVEAPAPARKSPPIQARALLDSAPVLTALGHLRERCEATSAAGRTEWIMLLITLFHYRKTGSADVNEATLTDLYHAAEDPKKCLPDSKAFVRVFGSKRDHYVKELQSLGALDGASALPDYQPIYSFVGVYIEPLQPDLRYVAIRAKNMQPQLAEYTIQLRSFLLELAKSI